MELARAWARAAGAPRLVIVVEGVAQGGHRRGGRLVGEVGLAEAGGCAAVQLAVGGGLSDPESFRSP